MKKLVSQKDAIFITLGFFLCILIVLPYFREGFFTTHDANWAVVRAAEMFRELRDFQFPPRYSGVLNAGYGYPLFNFAYPFPYYLATLFHFFNLGFVDSIKAVFVSSVFLSFLGMYAFSSLFWKNKLAGFVSGVIYVLLPYHLVDLFVRGSIGESVSFAIYPLVFFFATALSYEKYRNIAVLGVAFFTGIMMLTHNISALYLGIIYLVYTASVFLQGERKVSLFLLGSFIWGVLISAYFIIPALLEKNLILISLIPVANKTLHYVSLRNVFYSKWGYGTPLETDALTLQLGVPNIFGTLFVIGLIIFNGAKKYFSLLCMLLLGLIFFFMMFSYSAFIWTLPLLKDVTFPWTLLLPLGFLSSLFAGGVSKIKYSYVLSILFILLAVTLYLPFAKPREYINKGDSYYATNDSNTTSSNEYTPLWVKKMPTNLYNQKVISRGIVRDLSYNSTSIQFVAVTLKPEIITVNQIYYPGWKAYINGREKDIKYNNKRGVMQLNVAGGTSNITLIFTETPLRLVSDIVSLIAALMLLVFGIWIFISKKNLYGKKKKK